MACLEAAKQNRARPPLHVSAAFHGPQDLHLEAHSKQCHVTRASKKDTGQLAVPHSIQLLNVTCTSELLPATAACCIGMRTNHAD